MNPFPPALTWLLAFFLAAPAAAQAPSTAVAAPAQAVTLQGNVSAIPLEPALFFLVDATGELSPDQLEKLPENAFAAIDPARAYRLGQGALWLRFDAINQQPEAHWRLVIPLPGVDKATLHHRNRAGQWVVEQAGDRLPVSRWTQPARYPIFSLSHVLGAEQRYYLKIEHARSPYSMLPSIVSNAQLLTTALSDHILLGAYFGLAALVVVLALANAAAYRDQAFAAYAAYVGLFTVSQGMLIGVAGLYRWPEFPALNQGIIFVFTLAVAAANWFVRTVVMPKRFFRVLDLALLGLIAALPLAGLADVLLQSQLTFDVFNGLISLNMAVLLPVVGTALIAGDKHSRWIACGFTPVLLAAAVPLLRNLGVVQSSFWTEYALLIGSAIEVPILFYGLHRRLDQGRNIVGRVSGLSSTDPLTGASSTQMLTDRLTGLLDASPVYRQPFALLVIGLANIGELEKKYTRETADRALVMAAVRIRGLARPIDTVARVGDAQFALLMHGPVSSADATNLATKVVAAGLRATNQLPERDPLRFHIALAHCTEFAAPHPEQAQTKLAQLLLELKEMNDGSRKAIRVLKV